MAEFRTVAKASEIAPGTMKQVELEGEEVVLANVGGTYYAFSNTCSHEGGPLVDGELEGNVVTCPWHFTPFDIKSGAALEGGVTDDPIPVYRVRLEGDDIRIAKA